MFGARAWALVACSDPALPLVTVRDTPQVADGGEARLACLALRPRLCPPLRGLSASRSGSGPDEDSATILESHVNRETHTARRRLQKVCA